MNVKEFDKGTTYGFQIYSKSIVLFLTNYIGIPLGKKSDIIKIPEIFKKSEKLLKAFIRGYSDADFSLTLKKRYRDVQYYPVIVGVSKSKKMMEEVVAYLDSIGFTISRDFDREYYDTRFSKTIVTHRFQLYGHKQLILWMKEIGFSNPRNLKKYDLWLERNKKHNWQSVRNLIAGSGFEPLT